ncbi:hypothetical protein A2U01_0080504, partial [Trifolium medium]|nr:hypothetical protein [Trifolium medium]
DLIYIRAGGRVQPPFSVSWWNICALIGWKPFISYIYQDSACLARKGSIRRFSVLTVVNALRAIGFAGLVLVIIEIVVLSPLIDHPSI